MTERKPLRGYGYVSVSTIVREDIRDRAATEALAQGLSLSAWLKTLLYRELGLDTSSVRSVIRHQWRSPMTPEERNRRKRNRERSRYYRWKAQGKCLRCGRRRERDDRVWCDRCRFRSKLAHAGYSAEEAKRLLAEFEATLEAA